MPDFPDFVICECALFPLGFRSDDSGRYGQAYGMHYRITE